MFIWDKSSRAVLTAIMSSTTQKFYFTQIQEMSGLAPGTVASILERLTEAEILIREEERFNPMFDSPFRAERVYYGISPDIIDYLRI